jgi:hypothetical protein
MDSPAQFDVWDYEVKAKRNKSDGVGGECTPVVVKQQRTVVHKLPHLFPRIIANNRGQLKMRGVLRIFIPSAGGEVSFFLIVERGASVPMNVDAHCTVKSHRHRHTHTRRHPHRRARVHVHIQVRLYRPCLVAVCLSRHRRGGVIADDVAEIGAVAVAARVLVNTAAVRPVVAAVGTVFAAAGTVVAAVGNVVA